jgi:hypothetical protein
MGFSGDPKRHFRARRHLQGPLLAFFAFMLKNNFMTGFRARRALAVAALAPCVSASCARAEGTSGDPASNAKTVAAAPTPPPAPLTAAQIAETMDAARLAWRYFERNYNQVTGLVNATPNWTNTSMWDIGGQLIATHAAKELGLITPAEYDKRTTKTLATLETLPLFRGLAFNKLYSTQKEAFGNGARTGWSATDLGRLLLALKIVATRDPQFAAQAQRIAHRNDFRAIVADGYLNGQMIGSNGQPWTFQEGRIGYEQYAAAGFNQWGANANNASQLLLNEEPGNVLGVSLPYDKRYNDRLLSEPFILMGLELGLPADMRDLAARLLQAQEARFKSTGQMTIVSEDAVGVPPEYFYYYCVICNRKPFVIDLSTPGKERDNPRWVSTKGAYGWDAIMPSDYTRRAIAFVAPAKDAKTGWASGIYEGTGGSTKTVDINTSAVMLEIALYKLRGSRPLMEAAAVQAH